MNELSKGRRNFMKLMMTCAVGFLAYPSILFNEPAPEVPNIIHNVPLTKPEIMQYIEYKDLVTTGSGFTLEGIDLPIRNPKISDFINNSLLSGLSTQGLDVGAEL